MVIRVTDWWHWRLPHRLGNDCTASQKNQNWERSGTIFDTKLAKEELTMKYWRPLMNTKKDKTAVWCWSEKGNSLKHKFLQKFPFQQLVKQDSAFFFSSTESFSKQAWKRPGLSWHGFFNHDVFCLGASLVLGWSLKHSLVPIASFKNLEMIQGPVAGNLLLYPAG